MSKESPQSFGAGSHGYTPPALLSSPSQESVHVLQGNLVESTILFLQPSQKFLHVPGLTADGDRGQTALVPPISSEVGKPVGEGHHRRCRQFQASQEAKPVGGRLDKQFSRPVNVFNPLTAMLLASPDIGCRLDGWQANELVNSDVDPLGDDQKLPRMAQQAGTSKTLVGAMVQKSLSVFD
jgi:hypothetical protein